MVITRHISDPIEPLIVDFSRVKSIEKTSALSLDPTMVARATTNLPRSSRNLTSGRKLFD